MHQNVVPATRCSNSHALAEELANYRLYLLFGTLNGGQERNHVPQKQDGQESSFRVQCSRTEARTDRHKIWNALRLFLCDRYIYFAKLRAC